MQLQMISETISMEITNLYVTKMTFLLLMHFYNVFSTHFPSFKAEPTFPWEIKKHKTVVSFRESLETTRSSQIGPLTLRKSSAPLSALQMSEIARTHTLSSSRFRGGRLGHQEEGQTVSLDISQLQRMESEEEGGGVFHVSKLMQISIEQPHLPSQALSNAANNTVYNSKYLPSRPDDHRNRNANSNAVPTVVVGGKGISRPDLVGEGNVLFKAHPRDGGKINSYNSSSNSNNAKGRTVSVSEQINFSGTNVDTSKGSTNPPNSAGQVDQNGQKSSFSTLKKMSNFFQGKKG